MSATTRKAIAATILLAGLALQTALATKARALEPIPGSITFQGQPATKLLKSPIGSTFSHSFHAKGTDYEEVYRVREDRSLELLSRQRLRSR
jgi:hypothetical protein